MSARRTVVLCTLVVLAFTAVVGALATGGSYLYAQQHRTWATGNLVFVRMPVEGEWFQSVSYVQTKDGSEAKMVLVSHVPFKTWYEVTKVADGRWKVSTISGKDVSTPTGKMKLVTLLLEAQKEAELYLAEEDLLTRKPPGA